ncbi:hypothetical protein [Mucilaginibacter panaciglaebae]|uniref:DUF4249 family protein n=1 Tax=Mucilaginibacter panaciglaebae TaxID=502331 RepID=A0ABP7W8M3_9SPHI
MLSDPIRRCLLLALIAIGFFSCKFEDPIQNKISFNAVKGTTFIEVRRSFDNGLIFNKDGYQLAPIWRVKFLSDTTADVYNPDKKVFLKFSVTLDHDSIFNISGTWLKAMKVSKDSLIFQVLKVEGKTVYYVKSNVYMTLYSENYITNVLHSTIDEQRKPLKRDSAYIIKRTVITDLKADSFFAARKPVQITRRSPLATVEKKGVEADVLNKWDNSDEYMFPEYNVHIRKAYEDFNYSFWATVDTLGNIHYQKSMIYVMPEFQKATDHAIRGICDGYMKAYFKVIPGTTLGIEHNSAIVLNISGSKK